MNVDLIAERILSRPAPARRRLVALAGPPGSGKSTLAKALSERLPSSCVVPMDGFHLDNAVLEARGLLDRKGAPQTFDATGLRHLVTRLASEDEVVFPVFDRKLDRAIAGAGVVGEDTTTAIVEGNYLLLNIPVWKDLIAHWTSTIRLDVPMPILKDRLVQRWLDHGYSEIDAHAKASFNDLPNAEFVVAHSSPAEIVLRD